jgi:hypothetical protein
VTQRRRPGKVLKAAAIAVVAANVSAVTLVGVARWNPWHLVRLIDLAHKDLEFGAVIFAMASTVVVLGMLGAGRKRVAVASAIVAPLALVILFVGSYWADLKSLDYLPAAKFKTLAVSPDGGYEVVAAEYRSGGDSDAYFEGLKIRSRAGYLSKESDRLLAQFWIHRADQTSSVRISSVRFAGRDHIALQTSDGVEWSVRFDRKTTKPERTLLSTAAGGTRWVD